MWRKLLNKFKHDDIISYYTIGNSLVDKEFVYTINSELIISEKYKPKLNHSKYTEIGGDIFLAKSYYKKLHKNAQLKSITSGNIYYIIEKFKENTLLLNTNLKNYIILNKDDVNHHRLKNGGLVGKP